MGGRNGSGLAPLAAGFTVWAAGFVAVYATLSLGCAAGWDSIDLGPVSLQRAVVAGLSFVTALASVFVAARLARRLSNRSESDGPSTFLGQVAFSCALAATGATVFTFSGVVALSTCS